MATIPLSRLHPKSIAAVLLAGLVLAWPAFWSGYPMVFSDSASFLGVMNPWGQHWARPIFYSLALIPFTLNLTLWPAVILQGLVMAHLLWLTLRVVGGGPVRPGSYAGLVALVAVGSSLPWYVGQIMPDVLAPATILCAFLLGFGEERIGRWERLWLTALLALCVASHLSHLPLAAGLLICVAGLRLVTRMKGGHALALLPMAVAIAGAVSAHLAVNTLVRGHVTLSPSGPIFMLARSIADGPAEAYLQEVCPQAGYKLCAYKDQLPDNADVFLWKQWSPLWDVAGWRERPQTQTAAGIDYQPEAQAILDGTFERHLGWQIRAGIGNAIAQFGMNRTGDGLRQWGEEVSVSKRIKEVFPSEYDSWTSSRQFRGELGLDRVNALHQLLLPLAALAAVGLAVFLASPRYRLFVAVVALGILGNNIVMGAISGPHDRYGSRVACMAVLAAGVGLCLARRREETVEAGSRVDRDQILVPTS
ncbi:MAG TPA: hypothetical protein VED40_01035 [Azospirillaceae bacterium]|nr:hypothetical protein [Azospirillaceae bacterium]